MFEKIRNYIKKNKEQKRKDERDLAIATYCSLHSCEKCRYADSLLKCFIVEKFDR